MIKDMEKERNINMIDKYMKENISMEKNMEKEKNIMKMESLYMMDIIFIIISIKEKFILKKF